MAEGAGGAINPQGESTLSKMARGKSENISTEGDLQENTHLFIEGKMNEMTEETGSHGDIHLHAERKMNEMAREMLEED